MDDVERQVTLPADAETSWDLLTRPDQQAGWLGAEVDLRPESGAAGLVVDHDGTRRRVRVDHVETGRRLAWSWWIDGEDQSRATSVDVTLAPTLDGTLVTVTERPTATTASTSASACAVSGDAWSHRLLHLEALLLVAAAVRG